MKSRVLAVDDDVLILNAMRTALLGSSVELDIAMDAIECLRLVRQHPLRYAIVFLDYNLSQADGAEHRGDFVARRLKEINPEISVVMISGDESPEALTAWLEAGVDHFLYKPFQAQHVKVLAENECSKFESTYDPALESTSIPKNSPAAEALRRVELISVAPLSENQIS